MSVSNDGFRLLLIREENPERITLCFSVVLVHTHTHTTKSHSKIPLLWYWVDVGT
jgi:hypothetical protein